MHKPPSSINGPFYTRMHTAFFAIGWPSQNVASVAVHVQCVALYFPDRTYITRITSHDSRTHAAATRVRSDFQQAI